MRVLSVSYEYVIEEKLKKMDGWNFLHWICSAFFNVNMEARLNAAIVQFSHWTIGIRGKAKRLIARYARNPSKIRCHFRWREGHCKTAIQNVRLIMMFEGALFSIRFECAQTLLPSIEREANNYNDIWIMCQRWKVKKKFLSNLISGRTWPIFLICFFNYFLHTLIALPVETNPGNWWIRCDFPPKLDVINNYFTFQFKFREGWTVLWSVMFLLVIVVNWSIFQGFRSGYNRSWINIRRVFRWVSGCTCWAGSNEIRHGMWRCVFQRTVQFLIIWHTCTIGSLFSNSRICFRSRVLTQSFTHETTQNSSQFLFWFWLHCNYPFVADY